MYNVCIHTILLTLHGLHATLSRAPTTTIFPPRFVTIFCSSTIFHRSSLACLMTRLPSAFAPGRNTPRRNCRHCCSFFSLNFLLRPVASVSFHLPPILSFTLLLLHSSLCSGIPFSCFFYFPCTFSRLTHCSPFDPSLQPCVFFPFHFQHFLSLQSFIRLL